MMTSSNKEEDELGYVVIIMSQQLPDTDLLIKMGCLYLFLRPWLLPLPLTKLSQLLPFFFPFFVSHAKTSTGSNARFRQERTMGKASQWFVFPSDRRGEGGGSCFLAVVAREACYSFALSHKGGSVSQLSFD